MFCTECGKPIEGARFCVGCGTPADESGENKAATISARNAPATIPFNDLQGHATQRQSAETDDLGLLYRRLLGPAILVAALAAFWLIMRPHPAIAPMVYHCGEGIVIEACDQNRRPNCRIRNVLQQEPIHGIGVWAYDKGGVRIGSPANALDLNGLNPGSAVNTRLTTDTSSDDVSSIVLCSVDPESTVGSGRFGIGASAVN